MAKAIDYQPEPPRIGPTADEELQRLLQTLHEHGVLRLTNDLVASNNEWIKVIIDGLSRKGSLNVIQNISVLLMALSTIPPERMYKLAFGVRDFAAELSREEARPESEQADAPGARGAWKMLHDDELWRSLTPLLNGLKAFSRRMEEEVDKPISSFTGKPSDA
ncbi:DUF1641 domain-containing protein [Cronobacter sakazakii]|uniref:DUF1641 domain-containing protein n=3 Tax=Cronobacter TaxID=413496 RepID=A7MEK8_CROS8|nr:MULTISPECIES: DUF1641 domain-containing protein [Cronobacter]EGL72678.1 hypothetical protein CSE899_10527 [Cronobacter sakazakii E899]ELY6244113.1 DUF1641 domain-containing protein [Cronobacter universalis]MDK1225212.1 DUF1641 domain-containing protein [Cronobacter turicensis]CCK01338.1 FIG00554190: hypothetical protein [Cronobacter sakazakii 701]CCK05740.1 FIG00554190: hypothetical protein [Cronobacter sakazakii 696]CCK12817.1 FIG00554190: hypothetical protein [Cronobacter sakazakii 680]